MKNFETVTAVNFLQSGISFIPVPFCLHRDHWSDTIYLQQDGHGCPVLRTRKCHRIFAQYIKKCQNGIIWHFMAFLLIKKFLKMPFFQKCHLKIKMPTWQPWGSQMVGSPKAHICVKKALSKKMCQKRTQVGLSLLFISKFFSQLTSKQ